MRQMLQRLQDTQGAQEEKLQQAMGSHTIHLLFRDEARNTEMNGRERDQNRDASCVAEVCDK